MRLPIPLPAIKISSMDSTRTRFRRPMIIAATVLILIIAASLRFYNVNWDNGILAHPDERSTVAFYAPTIRWPADSATLFDPRASTLNPFWDVSNQRRRSYTYGHFPLYALVLVAGLLTKLTATAQSLGLPQTVVQFLAMAQSVPGYVQIGRGLMALADVGSVYLLFLLGRRLYGTAAGLLAAALAALTVLQIQLAHFFAVDPISTTFTLLALYGAVLMVDRQSTGAAILTGVGIALAAASKFSALPVAFVPVLAAWLVIIRQESAARARMIRLAGLALGVSLVLFALTSPFAFLDFGHFKQAVLDEQGNMVSGLADFPFTRQYRGTAAYWYFIEQQLRWGMGWPLGLLGLAGLGWVAWKAVRGKAMAGEWLALAWIALYFGPTGLFLAKFMRYMIPVVPLFTLFGAGLLVTLGQANQPTNQQTNRLINQLTNKLTKPLAVIIATVTLIGSAVWSLAFVNGVYGTEHPWVTMSRWMYANVPDGACIAWEHWDDRLPTSLPESEAHPGAHNYVQPQLPMYDEDTPQKYEQLRDTLINCDYIVLASNRLWRTIPRLPERYPMSSRFYEHLFDGRLGFTVAHAVETPPTLGPLQFDDQSADESFTVYDHPRPILFEKTRQLSAAEWDDLLGNSWQGAVPGYVGEPTLLMRLRGAGSSPPPTPSPANESKSLLLEQPVDTLPVVDDYAWNRAANNSTLLAIVVWWLALMLIGVAAWPLTFRLFRGLPNRGYGLSKGLGWLLVGYFVWLNSSVGRLPNRTVTAVLAVILLALVGGWLFRQNRADLLDFIRRQRRFIISSELCFSLVFLFFVTLRLFNPDLWQPWLGGEKMLEIGFLNAVVKSAQMPPYDPFFAEGIINYYYYGLFLAGVLIKLTGIQPSIAFNLAVPTLAALTAVSVFSLAANLTTGLLPFGRKPAPVAQPAATIGLKQIGAGLLAVLLVVFIGNLQGAVQFLQELGKISPGGFHTEIPGLQTLVLALGGLGQVLNGATLAVYNYWDPTRVIPATINEFPYFSFLFADLHPHMIGLPFTVLFLSLIFNRLKQSADKQTSSISRDGSENNSLSLQKNAVTEAIPSPDVEMASPAKMARNDIIHHLQFDHSLPAILRFLALPFVLGAIAIINTWDLPTYLGLATAAFLLSGYRRQKSLKQKQGLMLLVRGALFSGGLLALTYLLYAPFFINYQPPAETGLGLVHTQTALDQHLKIWGFFLLVIVSWLGVSLVYPASRHSLLRIISLGARRWNVLPHLTEIYRRRVKQQNTPYRLGLWSLVGGLGVALGLYLLDYKVPGYLLPLTGAALLLLLRRETRPETAYLSLLAFTGLLVLLGVEFFFLRDFLGGGDYYRMNTLFKFYFQVWGMFGVAAAVMLPQLWQWAWRWPWGWQFLWRSAALVLLLAGLVYTPLATRTRLNDRFPGARPPTGTLDGLAYMTVGQFEWPAGSPIDLRYDYEAIRWLQQNVSGTPIIAEAKVGYYREGGMRVAAYTGLPSILGGLHQNEQRPAAQVGQRDMVVNEFWTTTDPTRAWQLIDQLDISYIYLGQIERITYGANVGAKFEQLVEQGKLTVVFENEKTKIYRVREENR